MIRLRSIRLAVLLLPVAAAVMAVATGHAAAATGHAPAHHPNKPVCPGPIFGAAGCHSRVITDRAGTPLAGSGPSGYGPADFHGAYSLPNSAPTSETIAIVDAYDDPTIESDLAEYSSTYGLPACTTANGCFSKVNQSGDEGPYPKKDAGWALEISLDVEIAHAICQNCKILLVETDSNLFSDLSAGVSTAASLGATQISNSYGGGEYSGEATDTSYNLPGIAITASAGDSGYGAEYPAASPYVIAVGGTTLNLGPSSSYGSETVWSGSGSGCSAYVSAQTWQTSDANWALTGCGTKRGIADIAADADPNTGASVYDTTKYQGQSGWFTVGGTSLSAPLIAAVYGLAGGSSVNYPAADPYAHQTDSPASLHDVTSGSNGSCGTSIMCKGAVGYDGPTGVGTPKGTAAFGGGGGGGEDTTPPQTTIDSGPSGTTNDSTPTFAFSSSEANSTFECRVDGASFAACTSPLTTAALADGAHTFEVRATDQAGNTDSTPASRGFTVDTSAPQTTIDSGPSGTTNDSTPTFAFSSNESGSTFQCRIDSAAFAACTSPLTTAALTDGAHTFEVRATDSAGNADQSPASRGFTVDTTPPQTTIDAGPSGPTNDSTPTFAFSSSESGSTFECRVDGASFAACTSPLTTASLADGAHTFEVRATDQAGNADQSPASRGFTVDTSAPQTTIDSGPSGTTNDSTPTFAFSSSESGSTFECRVDGASFAACTSPLTTASLSDGAHTFEVRATGSNANTGVPATRSFAVDTTAPSSQADSPATTDSTTIDVTYTGSDGGSGLAAVELWAKPPGAADYEEVASETSPGTSGSFSYTAQAGDGTYDFYTRATDAVGNYEAAPVGADSTTVLDTTPSEPTATTEPLLTATSPAISLVPPTALEQPAAEFHLVKARSKPRRHACALVVQVPGPGWLILTGSKVKTLRRHADSAGSLTLIVRLRKRFRGLGLTKVTVIYTPLAGAPATKTATVRFG